MPIDWQRFKQAIEQHRSFILTSHIRPDCDALGSELGMARILRQVGKSVRILNAHQTPPALQFLDAKQEIEVLGHDTDPADIESDCLMILDTSAWAQLGQMADVVSATRAKKLVLDHHVGEDELGAELFKDTSAEATGHLVVLAADELGVPLDREIALPLFAAVATDTGWFRFSNTTSETYRIAGRLVDAGANPAQIYGDLYERDTLGRVRLRGLILSRIAAELEGRLVHTYVLRDDFEKCGALPSDTEDAVNLALGIAGTQVAVIMIEQLKGGFKISFRSRCDLDCNQLARTFGGGGHKAAAGAFVEGELRLVQQRVLPLIRDAMRNRAD
jgi:phosphoesterase RecJ-like protein